MATDAVQVSEAEYEADQKLAEEARTVRRVTAYVPGVGRLDVYMKSEKIGDLDES